MIKRKALILIPCQHRVAQCDPCPLLFTFESMCFNERTANYSVGLDDHLSPCNRSPWKKTVLTTDSKKL